MTRRGAKKDSSKQKDEALSAMDPAGKLTGEKSSKGPSAPSSPRTKKKPNPIPAVSPTEKNATGKEMVNIPEPLVDPSRNNKKVKIAPPPALGNKTPEKRRTKSLPAPAPHIQNSPQVTKKIDRSMSKPSIVTNSQRTKQQPLPAIPVARRLQKRFYEAVVMLEIFGKNRGDRIEEESFQPEPSLSSLYNDRSRRRSFLRHLAYLCDYEKGGDYTTAIALQSTPQRIIYRFASNKCSGNSDRTAHFMRTILESLRGIKLEDVERVESQIFDLAVDFSAKRIWTYVDFMKEDVEFIVRHLSDSDSAEGLYCGFKKYNRQCVRRDESANFATTTGIRESIESLHLRARTGALYAQRFDKIRHVIGRLNHTMKAVKDVVAAGLFLPTLFDDFKVARIKSSSRSQNPLKNCGTTFEGVVGRMMSDSDDIDHYRDALDELDAKFGLSTTLQDHCTSRKWRPRVHAELLVLDYFYTLGLEFLDGDRTIACSKPACYCCYHYISAHPGLFELPPSHNNCYIQWKAPDIFGGTKQSLVKDREDILNYMASKMRKEVLDQIRERRGPRSHQPDSWTEISSFYFAKLQEDSEESSDGVDSDSDDGLESDSEVSNVCDNGNESPIDIESDEKKTSDEEDFDSEDGGVRAQ